jgi:hypothetical protein
VQVKKKACMSDIFFEEVSGILCIFEPWLLSALDKHLAQKHDSKIMPDFILENLDN